MGPEKQGEVGLERGRWVLKVRGRWQRCLRMFLKEDDTAMTICNTAEYFFHLSDAH